MSHTHPIETIKAQIRDLTHPVNALKAEINALATPDRLWGNDTSIATEVLPFFETLLVLDASKLSICSADVKSVLQT